MKNIFQQKSVNLKGIKSIKRTKKVKKALHKNLVVNFNKNLLLKVNCSQVCFKTNHFAKIAYNLCKRKFR